MKALGYVLLVIVLLIVGVLIYGGISYAKIGKGEVRDLGVDYTMADYENAVEKKAGVEVRDPESLYLGSTFSVEGEKKVDNSFTQAEISAIQNYSNEKNGPFSDVQIKILDSENVEASGFVGHPQINSPVYVSGKIVEVKGRSAKLDLQAIHVGEYNLPGPLVGYIEGRFEGYVNGILADIEGLDVESIELSPGQARFVGTVPEKIR